jgi:predicted dehydrogenase
MGRDGIVRWGIIGCGDVVETKNGAPLYLADHSELSGIWNRTKQKAAAWCERHGHGRAYDSLDELLSDPEIDIVYVATTPDVHKEYACAVAEAGKHCYLEKPIALSWDEACIIKEAFEASTTRCFVAHYRRGMPRYRELKRMLDTGAIGKIRGVQIIRTQRQTAEEMLPADQKPWRVRPEVSGGSHFYEGDAHMLDLIDYLVSPLIDFKLEVINQTGYYEAEDAVSLSALSASGVVVSGTWCYATYKAIDRFLIFGDAGSIEFPYYDNAAPLRLERFAPGQEEVIAHEGVMGGVREEPEYEVVEIEVPIDAYPGMGQVQDIVDVLRGVPGAECTSTLDNALRTLWITWNARLLMKGESSSSH